MRKMLWFGAIVLALATGRPAFAQRSAFAPVDPNNIRFSPVDTRNVVGGNTLPAPNGPMNVGGQSKFLGFFPKLSMPSLFGKPAVGKGAAPASNSIFGSNSNSTAMQPLPPKK